MSVKSKTNRKICIKKREKEKILKTKYTKGNDKFCRELNSFLLKRSLTKDY